MNHTKKDDCGLSTVNQELHMICIAYLSYNTEGINLQSDKKIYNTVLTLDVFIYSVYVLIYSVSSFSSAFDNLLRLS